MTATVEVQPKAVAPRTHGLSRMLRIGLRELRGGVRGFSVFIACVALGVAVIAGVGALADGLRAGFERQGEVLLGGDVILARPHRRAEAAEMAWMTGRGEVSETATVRAMARRLDGAEQVLTEVKGIDGAYPLTGALVLDPSAAAGAPVSLLARGGAAVDPILLDQLGVRVGDRIKIGNAEVEIRARIVAEPDKITDRLTFGPRILVDIPTLESSGLAAPGSLVRWRYALRLRDGAATSGLTAFRDDAKKALPDSGFSVADRRDPSPQITKTLERLRQFLTLIGLTALLVGGVGVANAVTTYIDRRRSVIATMKSVGASNRQIFALHFVQMLTIAAIGIAIGLGAGMLFPPVLDAAFGSALPIRAGFALQPSSLATAVAYGLLVAFLFTLWPLGRAAQIRAAVLFRDEVAPERTRPAWEIIAAMTAAGAGLLALALATSESMRIAFYFCASLAVIFAVFMGLGHAVTLAARLTPRFRRPELRLAITDIGSPDGLARSVVLSLGAGLSLLVAVALADHSIVDELQTRLPKNSPDFFVLDIPRGDAGGLKALIDKSEPGSHFNQAPMLRGRIVNLAGKPVEQIKAPPEAQWVLNGDRGITYSETVPEGSKVVLGEWWPANYSGEPLISFEADLARLLGVKLGDSVTVNVLGRNIDARISNLREVHWESLSINFVMIFSPNTLRGAPHNLLATITLPKGTLLAREAALAREIGRNYPSVTAIRVRDAINSFGAVFQRIMTAVRAAGSITLIAGALVLAGALTTAQRRRVKQAAILKSIGGTRRQILAIHLTEYAILALITAALALVLGSIAAWLAVSRVIDVQFVFSWSAVGLAIGVALSLVFALGGYGTWRVLRAPTVPYLRSE